MSAEQQTITNDTIMSGVVCKKCGKVLPDHTVKTHLEDPKNSIFKCPSHKLKQEGFKWGQELLKWKTAHAELKTAYAELEKKYDDLVEKTLEENEGFLGEVSKDGYKDGWSDGCMETEKRCEKEIEDLKKELKGWEDQIESGHLECSENVLCSYDYVNDFIWNRVKDICHEDIPPQFECLFDGNQFIRGFKGMPELKKENEELKKEIENLKTELAGDDARMDKMEQQRIQEVQKLRAEIAILQGVSKNGKLKRVNPSK
jgi:flagellar motility protein MotE (MotC chaperone)